MQPANVVPRRSSSPGHHVTAPEPISLDSLDSPGPAADPELSPKTLSQTGRCKTAPLVLPHLWTSSVDRPQLSERDSIFATTYLATDSQTRSRDSVSRHQDSNDNVPDNGLSDLAVSTTAPRRLMEAPVLYQRSASKAAPTIKEHQGLLSTHFNSSRHARANMGPGQPSQSPPPFMSPVDLPLRPPSSPSDHELQQGARPLLDTLRESEARSRYRSWRKGNAEFPIGNGTARRLRDGSHVDKKIEATLPKTDQPVAVRSRKASHYLGVFKENDAAEEQKRREGRARERRPQDKALETYQKEELANKSSDWTYSLSRPSSRVQTPQSGPTESYFDSVPMSRSDVDQQLEAGVGEPAEPTALRNYKRKISTRRLEETANAGNLTTAATEESILSNSLSNAAAESLPKAHKTVETREPPECFHKSHERSGEHSLGSEEDESEKEQISSALYFPHRQLQSSNEIPQEEGVRKAEVESIQNSRSFNVGHGARDWSAKEAVKTPQEVEISLQSQNTNQLLHGDLPTAVVPEGDAAQLVSPPDEPNSAESDYESLAESLHSLTGYESSATDDLGTTPTGAPRKEPRHASAPQPPAPLGAVELKPYDHQVGGHSTVYRFSRRAVCKQLNNRENEFYETVERHHPELLEFLPRYEIFYCVIVVSMLRSRQRHFHLRRAIPCSVLCIC
jgi:inositol-hexakisphosphate kinase